MKDVIIYGSIIILLLLIAIFFPNGRIFNRSDRKAKDDKEG